MSTSKETVDQNEEERLNVTHVYDAERLPFQSSANCQMLRIEFTRQKQRIENETPRWGCANK